MRPWGFAAETFRFRSKDVHPALRTWPISISRRGRSRLRARALLLLLLRLWRWLHLAVLLPPPRLILHGFKGLSGKNWPATPGGGATPGGATPLARRGLDRVAVRARSGEVPLFAALVASSIGDRWLAFRSAPWPGWPRRLAPKACAARGEHVHPTIGACPVPWTQSLVPRAYIRVALVVGTGPRLPIVAESLCGPSRHHATLASPITVEVRIARGATIATVSAATIASIPAVATKTAHATKATIPSKAPAIAAKPAAPPPAASSLLPTESTHPRALSTSSATVAAKRRLDSA